MTDEQFNTAKELITKRDYYQDLLNSVRYEQKVKKREDEKAKESNFHTDKWTLLRYFRVRLFNYKGKNNNEEGKASVGVCPHYEFAHETVIDADDELITLIADWLEKKVETIANQIEEI